jgi:hypothetical protein
MADTEIKDEIDDAKQDLRDALHEINNRVEEGVNRLRPDRGIRKHPGTAACVAAALGFALGSESADVTMIGLLLLGATIVIANANKASDSK